MVSISKGTKSLAAGACGLIATLAIGSGTALPIARAAAPATRPLSLCMPAETPLFACAIGTKRVAVCGSGTKASYRYGQPGKIELTATALTLASQSFSGGGETQITATNKGYSYTIFDKTSRTAFGDDGRNDPSFGTGLVIRHGDKIVSSKMCDEDAPIASKSRQFMPAGPFVRH